MPKLEFLYLFLLSLVSLVLTNDGICQDQLNEAITLPFVPVAVGLYKKVDNKTGRLASHRGPDTTNDFDSYIID